MAATPPPPPASGDAHQSGQEARRDDRCETGDDTKYAVVWPQTAARLSQPALLNDRSDFPSAVRFPGGMTAWQEDACTPPTFHTLFIQYFSAFPSPLRVEMKALEGGGPRRPPEPSLKTCMELFVHVAPLSTLGRRLCWCASAEKH